MESLCVVVILCFLNTINAAEAPEFSIKPHLDEIHAGLSTDLRCSITNPTEIDPALNKTIIWCKDNTTLTDDVTVVNSVSSLHVTFKDSKNLATYGCGIEKHECQKTLKIIIITTTTSTTTTTTMPTATNPLTTRSVVNMITTETKENEESSAKGSNRSTSTTPGNGVEVVGGTLPSSSAVIPSPCTWLFGAVLIRTVVLA